jgi:hypothetical protein
MFSREQAENGGRSFNTNGYNTKNLFLVVVICISMPIKTLFIFLQSKRFNQGGFGL